MPPPAVKEWLAIAPGGDRAGIGRGQGAKGVAYGNAEPIPVKDAPSGWAVEENPKLTPEQVAG
jgi:hypothetical protein